MKSDKKIFLGKKGVDEYNGWVLPPSTWTTIQKIWTENGAIKVWNKKFRPSNTN